MDLAISMSVFLRKLLQPRSLMKPEKYNDLTKVDSLVTSLKLEIEVPDSPLSTHSLLYI